MHRIFISHASSDKKKYVEHVVRRLTDQHGEERVVYDAVTFRPGEKTLDEILNYLEKTDLFVILLSDSALDSDWVQEELANAYKGLEEHRLNRIFPLIVDPQITHQDKRIPDWLTQYNLKYIARPNKAAKLISERYKDITWNRYSCGHPFDDLFVGRNELIKDFEERLDNYERSPLVTVVGSGIKSIGRKSLIRECLKKGDIIGINYEFPVISLSYQESLEDFVLKVQDLGLTQEVSFLQIAKADYKEKIQLAIQLLQELQQAKEILQIEDDGCIIDYLGNVASWFEELTNHQSINPKITFSIISRFRPSWETIRNMDNTIVMQVPELDKSERIGLLTRALRRNKIELPSEDVQFVGDLLTGYPMQVLRAVEIIQTRGIVNFKKKDYIQLTEYNLREVQVILSEFEGNEKAKNILALLAEFDSVSLELIYSLLVNDEESIALLDKFFSLSIYDYEGALKEYIRLNGAIRDFVGRTDYIVSAVHKERLNSFIKKTLDEIDESSTNTPDLLYVFKESIKAGEDPPAHFLIPSVYLKSMSDTYSQGKYIEVVNLAKKALENNTYADERILYEIRYLLCSALAKLQKREFLDEVQHIHGAEHCFLMAFYYRQIGKNDRALSYIKDAIALRENYSKAKRELVLIYQNLEQYKEANILAKENYERYPNNPYHIQAYCDGLIRTGNFDDEKTRLIESMLTSLEGLNSRKACSMHIRCKAQYIGVVHKDSSAYQLLKQAERKYPEDRKHCYTIHFEVATALNDHAEMEAAINNLRKIHHNKNSIIIMESKLLAKKGNEKEAVEYFKANIRNFTDESKRSFCEKLSHIN